MSSLPFYFFVLTACSPTKSKEEYLHLIEMSWVRQDMDACRNIFAEYAKEYKQEIDTKAVCEEWFEYYDREFKVFRPIPPIPF